MTDTVLNDHVARAPAGLGAALALATLAAGSLDVAYASAMGALQGRTPVRVMQSIAGGWLGPESFKLGYASAALGLVTHFAITFVMAAGFALAARLQPQLAQRPWIAGPIYGLGLYGVMYGLVLPLRWPQLFPKFNGLATGADLMLHMAFGLAIALIVGRGVVRPAA